MQDPTRLIREDADAIADTLYVPQDQLPAGVERIALKEIHLNRCPALVQWDHLREADLARLRIDPSVVEANLARLRAAGPQLAEKIRRIYARAVDRAPSDCDASLYDGFLPDEDRERFPRVRSSPPAALAGADFGFRDERLPELLFRYRARNWRGSLAGHESERWNGYRRERLAGTERSENSFDSYFAELDALRADRGEDARVRSLLDALQDWGRALRAELA
jgi:exodeoxyribonuclease-1